MSGPSGIGGGLAPSVIKQFQQNLFSQIDADGNGSVSKTELEQAVTKGGGNATAADALYSVLDPKNAGGFGEQQLSQVLPGSGFSDQMQAQLIGYQAQGWPGASGPQPGGPQPVGQLAQSLFSQIDGNGDGTISQSELEQAVTKAGGTKEGADALYAKLDPNGTGSVSAQQFINTLQPPSAGGNTAQDALLALLDQVTQGNATAPVGGATGATAAISTGTSAQDALAALVQSFDPTRTGNSAQDAIAALLNPSDGSSNGAATVFKNAEFAHALSLYQGQLEQQLMASIGATQSASV
jgi:Ca2+-binding EF-hand superfamily protein